MTAVAGPPLRRRVRSVGSARDTDATAFTGLLAELISRVPGAHAAALVDGDGESIDYAGALAPFDVKIAAAHWQIVLGQLAKTPPLVDARHVVVRAHDKSYVLHALADGYAVIVVLSARGGFAASSRGFAVFERSLRLEAGIGGPSKGPPWTPVTVEYDARARPRTVASGAHDPPQSLEVLGAVMGLGRGERGFRIRLASGVEATVVREPGGAWYSDEPIGSALETP
jgi:hypothetical protein